MILLLLPAALAADATPPTADATPLAGTWNVVLTWGSGTCPDSIDPSGAPGATSAYQWLISTQAEGAFSISVLGQTAFPSFAGVFYTPDNIVATAYGVPKQEREGSWLGSATTVEMALKDGALTGTRLVQLWQPLSGLFPGFPLHVANVPCYTGGTFTAKR